MKKSMIDQVRLFNRFYTNALGLFDKHLHRSTHTFLEARIMFEMNQNKRITSNELINILNVDKGYLSRVLKKMSKEGLINRIASEQDGRCIILELSKRGLKEFSNLNKESNIQIELITETLEGEDLNSLVLHMNAIKEILTKKRFEYYKPNNLMEVNLELKKASIIEISDLQKICKELYSMYFGNYWKNDGLELYLEDQFGKKKLELDLASEFIGYYFITMNRVLIGFLKVNYKTGSEDFNTENACELEKMYIHARHRGEGIGRFALDNIIDKIRKRKKAILFLDVLDTNKSAISFYEKLGFKFHSKTQLENENFKEKFKGINRMFLKLK